MVVKKKVTAKKPALKAAVKSVTKKPVPAKPAPARKTAPAKKLAAPVKTVAVDVSTPKAAQQKKCGMICWKKIVIFLLGVVIGAGAILATTGHRKYHKGFNTDHMFKGGCLDISKIKGVERIEKLRARGLDIDGCITKEQFFTEKGDRMHKGCGTDCPHKQETERARTENRGQRTPRGEVRREVRRGPRTPQGN